MPALGGVSRDMSELIRRLNVSIAGIQTWPTFDSRDKVYFAQKVGITSHYAFLSLIPVFIHSFFRSRRI